MASLEIEKLTFQVEDPYAEGQSLTALEAAALNGLRRENLRNNFRKRVQAAAKAEGGLTDGVKARLAAEFSEYAEAYEFAGRRGPGASRTRDPIEAEARKIARATVHEHLKKKGLEATKEQVDDLIGQYLDKFPQIREAAARRVEEVKSIASEALD